VAFTPRSVDGSTLQEQDAFTPGLSLCSIKGDGTLSGFQVVVLAHDTVPSNTALSPAGTHIRALHPSTVRYPGSCFFRLRTGGMKDISP